MIIFLKKKKKKRKETKKSKKERGISSEVACTAVNFEPHNTGHIGGEIRRYTRRVELYQKWLITTLYWQYV